MDAADRLKTWRARKGLTLLAAGETLGCDWSLISKLEHRRQKPGYVLRMRIQSIVKIEPGSWDDVDIDAPPPRTRKKRRKGAVS